MSRQVNNVSFDDICFFDKPLERQIFIAKPVLFMTKRTAIETF